MNKTAPVPVPPLNPEFSVSATNDNNMSLEQGVSQNKKFNRHFDRLLSEIWFSTEEESIKPENVEKTKQAFRQFLKNMGWPEAAFSFEELLLEKTGEFEFRADGKTPNWYHEFRESLWALNFVRRGLISERDVNGYGGTRALVAIILRHDSGEDLGNLPDSIAQKLQSHIRTLHPPLSNHRIEKMDMRIDSIRVGIDLLTRKIPVLDADGNFVRKENGKIKKEDRFGGDVLVYYSNVLQHPFAAFGKLLDGIEGMVTRVGVKAFSVEDDKEYANERRMLYGRQPFEADAIGLYPFLKKAIKSADSMLGISLVMMETLNDFAPGSKNKPSNARKMSIERYLEHGLNGFEGLPPAFHPIQIKMGRMIAKAKRENDGRVAKIIERAFLPALIDIFPNLRIYNDFSGLLAGQENTPTLPNGGVYAPNMR